jgi:hypothetical protein
MHVYDSRHASGFVLGITCVKEQHTAGSDSCADHKAELNNLAAAAAAAAAGAE